MIAFFSAQPAIDQHPVITSMIESLWGGANLLAMLWMWLCLVCTVAFLWKAARCGLDYFATWWTERRRYKLPKTPDNYRLN